MCGIRTTEIVAEKEHFEAARKRGERPYRGRIEVNRKVKKPFRDFFESMSYSAAIWCGEIDF
jgi:hypothetical protein